MRELARRRLIGIGASLAVGPPLFPAAPAFAAVGPMLVVWKNRGCACCVAWAREFQDAGFVVAMHEVDDPAPVRNAAGVPEDLAGCHTARVDGYIVEGHVPVADVQRQEPLDVRNGDMALDDVAVDRAVWQPAGQRAHRPHAGRRIVTSCIVTTKPASWNTRAQATQQAQPRFFHTTSIGPAAAKAGVAGKTGGPTAREAPMPISRRRASLRMSMILPPRLHASCRAFATIAAKS